MSGTSASVNCSIEIYPFEGGPYTIQGGQIISVSFSKTLLGNSEGAFSIALAPGGPMGVEDLNTWSQIITPMSLVLIGMTRGNASRIITVGVVNEVSEHQEWHSDDKSSTASRAQLISGFDISYFFNTFSFWALSFMGIVAGTGVGGPLGYQPNDYYALISQGLYSNSAYRSVVDVGRFWFQNIMGGKNGVLNSTYFPYKPASTKILFKQAVAAFWEYMPDVVIPHYSNYMLGAQTWMSKLKGIFNSPWYELFTTTAAPIDYKLAPGSTGLIDQGHLFTMSSQPNAPGVSPQLVARVNPLPKFGASFDSSGSVTPGPLDMVRWNNLPLFDFSQANFGFIKSRVNFNAQNALNFYQINPTIFGGFGMDNGTDNRPSVLLFLAGVDAASLQRYGFKPGMATTSWFFVPNGQLAGAQTQEIQMTMELLTCNYASWMHPEPLMARASIEIPLNPVINIGTRFRYAPFKAGETWDFYVESFKHEFTFGGPSRTVVNMSRGLPTSVYADSSSNGVLQAIHQGNAMRMNGNYVKGLPSGSAPSLTFINTPEQGAAVAQGLTNGYVTPQVKTN